MNETIVLVPGIIAPSKVRSWEYFKNIPAHLISNYDVDVHVIDLPEWGTLDKRAPIILHYFNTTLKGKKVHLIAHSKGGLEVRSLLERGLINDQVKSFTSISCPYRGTIIASIFYYFLFPLSFIPLFKNFMMTLKELRLGEDQMTWTKEYTSFKFPCYYVNSIIPTPLLVHTYPLFWLTNSILNIFEGKNDGFVSAKSSEYGELIETFPSDHIGMIGHFGKRKLNHLLVYDTILKKLDESIITKEK